MIAFDISVVAQKMKVVVIEDRCDLKKQCVTNRSGWLLELLTELINGNFGTGMS